MLFYGIQKAGGRKTKGYNLGQSNDRRFEN